VIDRVWLKALIEGALLVLWEADACDDDVGAVRGYLQRHSRNPALTRVAVARAIGRSESWLAHHLKQLTRRSFVDHLNDFRLTDAQRLLTHTTEGIKQIAHTVGCKRDSALTALFRNRLGVPPSAWRTAHQRTSAHEHTSTRAHEHTRV
jgi:AraC-like DNA-binding protein